LRHVGYQEGQEALGGTLLNFLLDGFSGSADDGGGGSSGGSSGGTCHRLQRLLLLSRGDRKRCMWQAHTCRCVGSCC
jgi:hypothetical protein